MNGKNARMGSPSGLRALNDVGDRWLEHPVPASCSLFKLAVASALSVALLLPGCGLPEKPVTREPSPPVSERGVVTDRLAVPCEQTITEFSPPGPDLNTVDPDFEIVGGVAALRTAGSYGHLAPPAALGFYDDPALRLASKTPVLVRRGSTFELRVPDSFRDRVALDFAHSRPPAFRLAFGPCESETEWLLFIGYVWVANQECVALEVV